MERSDVIFYNLDFAKFLDRLKLDENSYVYFDQPYLISNSEYNKNWNASEERRLCECLDELNRKGIRFGTTNLVLHKGVKNDSREVFVTNYGNTKSKTAVVFDNYKNPRKNTEISQMCLAF